MLLNMGYWTELGTVTLDDSNRSWIQAVPTGTYNHELYGELNFDAGKIKNFADNINSKVRGIEPDVDYDHKAYGGEAAGWIKAAEATPQGLRVQVEWTPKAADKIRAKEYKYFSPELADEWTHPKTNVTHKDVVLGGAVTNRPFLKDIMPLNLSEVLNPQGGKKVVKITPTMKPLALALGLAEDCEEDVFVAKLSERLAAPTNPADPPKTDPVLPKELAEHPAFKAMFDNQAAMAAQLAEISKANKVMLAEKQVAALDNKDRALPPVVKESLVTALSEGDTAKVIEAFQKLSEVGFVPMGETQVNSSAGGGGGQTDVVKKFADAVNKIVADDKVSEAEAMNRVAKFDPKLFAEYREASYHPVKGGN